MKDTTPNNHKAVAVVDPASSAFTVQQVLQQVALIQQIMGTAMKDGEHFGRIPGCGDKPTLLKAGAEKLCLTFRLAPTYDVDERQLPNDHREYRIQCTLTSILSGAFLGQGVGTCSSMESKFRFRQGAAEPTDKPVPRSYWDLRGENPAKAQELIGGKGFTVKKVEGKGWMIAKGGEKVEHDNPTDTFNTILKMAKKRALVDAVLTATAASDIFTQDLEDISANIVATAPPAPTPSGHTATIAEIKAQVPAVQTLTEATGGAEDDSPAWDVDAQETVVEKPAVDFRETRVHFGKNRGLMLSELSPQQRKWYLEEWLPKKQVNGPTSVEDLALINALQMYRDLGGEKGAKRK